MKIKKAELMSLIEESVIKQKKKLQIEAKIKDLEGKLISLNETAVGISPAPMQDVMQDNPVLNAPGSEGKAEKRESIFDARYGDIIIFNFQDVTIKVQRLANDLFQIIDAAESKKLKEGDYIQIKGNDIIEKGRRFKFSILRKAIDYESNPLVGWKIIKK